MALAISMAIVMSLIILRTILLAGKYYDEEMEKDMERLKKRIDEEYEVINNRKKS